MMTGRARRSAQLSCKTNSTKNCTPSRGYQAAIGGGVTRPTPQLMPEEVLTEFKKDKATASSVVGYIIFKLLSIQGSDVMRLHP